MKRDANKERCVECLRVPCRCAEYPGMKVLDSELIDMAATCSNRGLRLNAELVLRQRWPGRRQRLSFHKGETAMRLSDAMVLGYSEIKHTNRKGQCIEKGCACKEYARALERAAGEKA